MDSTPYDPSQDQDLVFSGAKVIADEEAVDTDLAPENGLFAEPALDTESEQRVRQKWQQVRCYGFKLPRVNLIAPLGVYCELLTQPQIEPLPNSPPHCLGLCNVRGNLIPVYRLDSLLEDDEINEEVTTADAKSFIQPDIKYALVIGPLEQAAALVIKTKPLPFDLGDFNEDMQLSCDSPLLEAAISRRYRLEQDSWYMLDHRRLFTALANYSPENSI